MKEIIMKKIPGIPGTIRKSLNSRHYLMMITLSASVIGTVAQAEVKKPDHEVSYNLTVATDYRFRGISQTRREPTLQGTVDYVYNPGGWYAGSFISNVKFIKDVGGGADVEIDLYGGKRGSINSDVGYDVGVIGYVYPANGLRPDVNTFEVFGQLNFGPAYTKYSLSTTNLFGFADSKRSGYLDVGANFEVIPSYTLNLHVGRQNVRRNGAFNYTDYKIGVTKDFGFVNVSLAAIRTDTDAYVGGEGKNLGKKAAVLSIFKIF
jgi:uncharacterized protein (TIGR02001 family)